MPKGMRNPENMPRGMCRCGGPTEAKWADERMRSYAYVCVRCQLPGRDCKCLPVEPIYCPDCGEKTGDRAPEGMVFVPSLKVGHICKKRR